jgi:heme-degrading monooxygenase HmoA
MFARVAGIVRGDASPEHGVAFFRDRVLPDLRRYEGFREAMVLVPREGEEVLVISFWDTEENLLGAEATPAAQRASAARETLGPQTTPDARVYEVAFRAGARDQLASG